MLHMPNWLKTCFLLDFPPSTSHSYKWISKVNICEKKRLVSAFTKLRLDWIFMVSDSPPPEIQKKDLMKSFLARLFNLTIVNGGLVTGGQCSYGFPPFAFPTTRQPAFTTPQDIHSSALWSISAGLCSNCLKVPQRWSMEARSQF